MGVGSVGLDWLSLIPVSCGFSKFDLPRSMHELIAWIFYENRTHASGSWQALPTAVCLSMSWMGFVVAASGVRSH